MNISTHSTGLPGTPAGDLSPSEQKPLASAALGYGLFEGAYNPVLAGDIEPSQISPEQNDPSVCVDLLLFELVCLKRRVSELERKFQDAPNVNSSGTCGRDGCGDG